MVAQLSAKRKAKAPVQSAHKKAKTVHLSANELPWKTVSKAHEAGLDAGLEGIMELEEVDGVDVVYEETEAGRIVKFSVKEDEPKKKNAKKEKAIAPTQQEQTEAGPSRSSVEPAAVGERPEEQAFDSKTLLPSWHQFSLHPQLNRTLYAQSFSNPTPIQAKAIPAASKGKDVIGVAETGSGKTLAYGIPILHYLLTQAKAKPLVQKQRRPTRALILAPTRELALQVSSHLNACLNVVDVNTAAVKQEEEEPDLGLKARSKGKGKAKAAPAAGQPSSPKLPPLVSVAAIVGGMSAQKQRRILERGVDVLVATPGRLWDIMQDDDALARDIKSLKFLVLDEADRMIENGHFAELDNIIRLTLKQSGDETIEPELDFDDDGNVIPKETAVGAHGETNDELQTFVFSATLSKDLQRNLKKRSYPNRKKNKPATTLDDLLLRLDFRDPEPEVIDLSPEGGVVSTLRESRIDCLTNDKDAYLYYFLLRYPGRSLVFLSSIDGIRRLMPLMELLQLPAYPLHSQLEQRQRLKNLDRFKSTQNSILLATDIAARGLDIPAVDHVVHYQIPRSADVYVHRNGRTARAMRSGFSLLMVSPDERRVVRALLGSLGRQEEEIPDMSIELYLLDKIKARIQVAKDIDSLQHKVKKENHEKNWLKEAAAAMEIEVDSDMGLSDDDGAAAAIPSKHQRKTTNAKTAVLKAELKELLAQPLIARGVSTRYITSGSRPIVDDYISGEYHENMLGLKKTQAGQDVVPRKARKVVKKEEYEEWKGFES
ncbi:DEAD/DEAH box helicase [Phanerochaete sordida]|uniref:RNA helicase n=1 Tax=Phanerochaete sordida TaxID=48140 RepID=A0A9P3L7W8_9APHY|nr:DEAD/DEAH box helicase [Phanerochaete sordida]